MRTFQKKRSTLRLQAKPVVLFFTFEADLLRLRPNLTLDLVEDIPAQSQELFPVARPGLDRFPEGFRHGLFRVADRLP